MTHTERLKTTPDLLNRVSKFFQEDDAGKAYVLALNERVLAHVPAGAHTLEHAAVFHSGVVAGANSLYQFTISLDPEIVAQEIQQKEAQRKLAQPRHLPSVQAEIKARQEAAKS